MVLDVNSLVDADAGLISRRIFIEDDIMYVTDRADSVALKFTLDGKPLQVIGRRGVHSDTGGEVPGEVVPQSSGPFNYPTQLVPAPSGDLYVSDGYRNARVHRFSPDGRLLASWGEPGKEGPSQFHLPHSVLVDGDGLVTFATGKTILSRSVLEKVGSSPCGPICAVPWIYRRTLTASCTSARAEWTVCHPE